MKRKTAIIIAVISAVIIITVILLFITKGNKNSNIENDGISISVTSHTEENITENNSKLSEDIIVSQKGSDGTVYVPDGELKYKDLKLYVTDNKIVSEKDGSKEILSDQNCAENITVYNGEIYYTVINSQETITWSGDELLWKNCSCWKMNTDGSQKSKIFDFDGSGYVIHIDDDSIYYVGDLSRDDYYQYAKAHNGFFRYDKKSGKTSEIITDGGLKFADPVFIGGKFLFSTSKNGFCLYDTSTEKKEELTLKNGQLIGIPQDTVAYDESTGYFTDREGSLYIFHAKNNSVELFCEIDSDCTEICGKGDGCLFFRTYEDNYKKFDLKTKTFSTASEP